MMGCNPTVTIPLANGRVVIEREGAGFRVYEYDNAHGGDSPYDLGWYTELEEALEAATA